MLFWGKFIMANEYYSFKLNPRFVSYFKSLEDANFKYKNLLNESLSKPEKRQDPIFEQRLHDAEAARQKAESFFCEEPGSIQDISSGQITENEAEQSAEAVGRQVDRYMGKVKSWYA